MIEETAQRMQADSFTYSLWQARVSFLFGTFLFFPSLSRLIAPWVFFRRKDALRREHRCAENARRNRSISLFSHDRKRDAPTKVRLDRDMRCSLSWDCLGWEFSRHIVSDPRVFYVRMITSLPPPFFPLSFGPSANAFYELESGADGDGSRRTDDRTVTTSVARSTDWSGLPPRRDFIHPHQHPRPSRRTRAGVDVDARGCVNVEGDRKSSRWPCNWQLTVSPKDQLKVCDKNNYLKRAPA